MPRFVGKKTVSVWADLAALIVFAIVVVLVLALADVIPIFGL